MTHTITTTYTQTQDLLPVTPKPHIQGSNIQGLGRPLGVPPNSNSSSSTTSFACEERIIYSNLEALLADGCALRVELLVEEMISASFLSSEAHQTIHKISQAFTKIDSSDWEGQADAIAMILFRIIRPALKTATSQEQVILRSWERACIEIVTLILPVEEDVKIFLEVSEIALREERLACDISKKSNEVSQLVFKTIEAVAQRVNQNMDNNLTSSQQHMMTLQIKREEELATTTNEMNLVSQEIAQLVPEILNGAMANYTMGSKSEEQKTNVDALVDQCKVLLAGVSILS